MPRMMPLLILFSYLEDAVQAIVHLRMHANQMAIIMNSWEIIGVIYMLLDIAIILTGTVLIASSWNDGSGVVMLLLPRTLRSFAFGMWDYELLLDYCVNVACLLLLLAMRLSQRQADEWHNRQQQQRNLQRLLLLGRICMCCVFLLWIVEKHQIINKPFAVACFIFMLFGVRCKLMASLTVLILLWHCCFQANGSLIFGWNDLTISMQFISSLLSRVAGFFLLARLGGGKWSVDALV
ncbi:surfeit locus protein 4 homolog [Drosophila innubila]|uniref:surfeit locus protein 4 homolog n=1 Tax=Drosophila innubila TaxID=198719 RepID=UPI00148D21ED|nr:surfeit locus protein 4 homolog [Drosophila innubila]